VAVHTAHCVNTTAPEETPVGFVAMIPHTGTRRAGVSCGSKQHGWGSTCAMRAHRTVVLPQWQGFGIGSRLSDAAAELARLEGREYFGQTVHPRFGKYRDASPLWEATRYNHVTSRFKISTWKQRLSNIRVKLRTPRFQYSHKYVGPRSAEEQIFLNKRVCIEE
jgi:GNAT superfamily N-acetyltransferase